MDKLFALDTNTEEVVVSESSKGSIKINLIERISRKDNEILYNAVLTLTSITNSSDLDVSIFKAMDKVCQMVYQKHENSKNQ
jgi:hypothetical protein